MTKLTSLFAALLMASTTLLAETVNYIDANGQSQSVDATEVTNSTSTLSAGWYVVNGEDVQTGGLVCKGAVNLILADGAKLTATARDLINQVGIQVSGEGNSLTIYGQINQTGELVATGGKNGAAGIGGGFQGNGSNITINGGIITANGTGEAAGIGGGDSGSGSNITINGGVVTAIGGINGAGFAAGIGGGRNGSGENITINGGVVTAIGAGYAAGIGGGRNGSGENITINGGTVTATGGENAAGIGGGEDGSGSNIFVATTLIVKAGESDNSTEEIAANRTATTDLATELADKQYVTIDYALSVSYIDASGVSHEVNAIAVKNSIYPVNWTAGWYIVTGTDVTLSQGAICNGAVNLILADGTKLTSTGIFSKKQAENTPGIYATGDNSLTIYGQTAQTGELVATGGDHSAGIGGGWYGNGNVTINGGIVTATGGILGAGIGNGSNGNGSNITINGGIVTANGGAYEGFGIGGTSSNIIINGGEVTANGAVRSTGIGGGDFFHNIIVSTNLIIKADNNNPPTTEIINDGSDLADALFEKRYVTIKKSPLPAAKTAAIAEVNADIEDVTNEGVIAIATAAKTKINVALTEAEVNDILAYWQDVMAAYAAGLSAGLGSLAEPCDGCPAVIVTDGETTIKLYNPTSVSFERSVSADEN